MQRVRLVVAGSALVVLTGGVVWAQEQRPLDANFTVSVGQRVTVSGTSLAVRVDEVANDSRCPRDARCITAGDAEVRLSLATGTARPRTVSLHTAAALRSGSGAAGAGGVGSGGGVRLDGGPGVGGAKGATPQVTLSAVATEGGFEIRLVDLAPETMSTREIAQKDYRVTLRVTRQSTGQR